MSRVSPRVPVSPTVSSRDVALVIVGAGGFGREVLDVVEAMNAVGADIEFVGYVDDAETSVPLLDRRGAPVPRARR